MRPASNVRSSPAGPTAGASWPTIRIHGPDKLAGLNYVDAGQKADPAFIGPNLKNLPLMASEDLAVNIAATRAFLRDCFSKQPTPEEYETMLAFNMMVPPKVRLA